MKKILNWQHKHLLIFILSVWLATACSSTPEIIHHPAPEFNLDTTPFESAGCSDDGGGRRVCPPESALAKLGCRSISNPGAFLGGLEPAYPINMCWQSGMLESDAHIYQDGCLAPQYIRYVIKENQFFRVIQNKAELAATYAPVLSKDEALSYALAATGLAAYYDLETSKTMRYFTDRLEDTHVEVTPEGYIVHLYHYKLCGCGPHTTTAVDILVRQDGRLEELVRQPAFEDPSQDGLCVD